MAAKLGIVGLSRGIALDMAALQCALERDRAVRLEPHDRLDPDRDRRREAARRAAAADDAGEDRAARGLSLLRQGRRHLRADLRRAQQRDLPVQPDRGRSASLHRSDGWTPEKLDAQLKGAFGPSFTPLERSGDVFTWDPTGRTMAIVYDKLLALKIPDVEHTYTDSATRCFYALGLGLGHDPLERGAARFRLREEPQGAADLRRGASAIPASGRAISTPASTG